MKKSVTKAKKTKKPFSINKKVATMLALVLALGAAVYMNWRFADAQPLDVMSPADEEERQGESYGDALFVSSTVNIDEYFAEARLARSTSRDEALAALQNSLKNTELSETEKSELTAKLTAQANSISQEAKVESLIKAKGFSDCVVYIYQDSAKVVVASGESGLTEAQVAQIMETVISQTEITAQHISIVEVK